MTTPTWWQNDKRWRSPRLPSGAHRSAPVLFVAGALFSGLAMPATLAIPEELGRGNSMILSVLLFHLVGLALWGVAVREALAWRRFGEIHAVLDPWPGAIGGDIAGYFDLSRDIPADHQITVTLRCVLRRRGNKTTTNSPVWTDEIALMPLAPGQRQIWFHFAVPDALPESEDSARRFHYWELQLRIRHPGADAVRRYDIPAFAGSATNGVAARNVQIDPEPAEQALRQTLNLCRDGDTVTLHYRAGRGAGGALALLAFGVVSLASATFVAQHGGLTLLMAGVFGLFGAPMTLAGLWWLGKSRLVRIAPDQVSTRVLWLGLPVYTRRIARSAARQWAWVRRGSMHSSTRTVVWHDLIIRTATGQDFVIGNGFESERHARDAAQRLAELTGIAMPD